MNHEIKTLVELIEIIESVGNRHPLYFSNNSPSEFNSSAAISLCTKPDYEAYYNVVGAYRIAFPLDGIYLSGEDMSELLHWIVSQTFCFAVVPVTASKTNESFSTTEEKKSVAIPVLKTQKKQLYIAIGHKCAITTCNEEIISFFLKGT